MIANGFKPVAWVAAVGSAALGCYMLSLRVASERADLASLDRQIVAAQQQIRALQTELGTRGRLQQLEQWNEQVLALSAPVSGQYLQSSVQLARFSTTAPQPLDNAAEIRMASAETAPEAAPATPAPRHAVAGRPAVAAPPPVAQPIVQRASLALAPQPAPAAERPAAPVRQASPPRSPAATPVRVASAEARPATPRERPAASEARRPAPARSGRAALLDERTLSELGTAARAERRGGTRD